MPLKISKSNRIPCSACVSGINRLRDKKGRVAESNFCGTPFLQTNQEKNGNIASKAAT
jgi:hypothetical protein